MWRAIRFGQDAELLDLEAGGSYPGASAAERLLSWTEPMRRELGISVDPPGPNGAQRQRAWLAEGQTLEQVYARCVEESRATYAHGFASAGEVNR